MTIKERILTFIDSERISINAFERACGFSNGYVKSMNDSVGSDKLKKIITVYPNLSIAWLVSGIGPMSLDSVRSEYQGVYNQQFGNNSFQNNSDITLLLERMETKDKQIDRLLKMLEHIVYKDGLPQ